MAWSTGAVAAIALSCIATLTSAIPGDFIQGATIIDQIPAQISGSTNGLPSFFAEIPGAGPSVLYELTPATTVFVSIDTCQSAFDTTLRVFKAIGDKLDEIAQNDDSQFCDAFSLAAIDGVTLASGSTYYIAVSGFALDDSGDYTLRILEVAALPPTDSGPLKGDVNFDSEITIQDIIVYVNSILGTDELNLEDILGIADLDSNNTIDVNDIIILVSLELGSA